MEWWQKYFQALLCLEICNERGNCIQSNEEENVKYIIIEKVEVTNFKTEKKPPECNGIVSEMVKYISLEGMKRARDYQKIER